MLLNNTKLDTIKGLEFWSWVCHCMSE